MAVAVATTASNTITGNTSLTITKPTGLAVGDGLVAVIYSYSTVGGITTINTPAGWEATQDVANSAASDNHRVAAFVKVADSSDVAASNFTFTTTDTVNIYGVILRTTGSRTDDIYGVGASFSNDSAVSTSTYTGLSVTPAQDTVLLVAAHAVAQNENWYDSTSPVISGTNPTWTKQFNSNVDVFTAPVATTTEITSFSITNTGAGGSDTVGILFAIYGQQDASATLSLTSTTNTAITPAGSAGARTTVGLTTTTNTKLDPVGRASSPTKWTNEPDVTTTWTKEQRL